MVHTNILYIGNDNLLVVDKLFDTFTETYLDDTSSVTVTLLDSSQNEVSGQVWPTTLDYIAASEGKFSGVLEDGLVLIAKETYTAQINVNAGNDRIARWKLPLIARERDEAV